MFHHSRQEEKELCLVFVLHHDHAQIHLSGVANPYTELLEVHVGVEEETVLQENSLLRTESPAEPQAGAVILVYAVETLNKGADVFRLFIFGGLVGWLEGSHISKYRALDLTG